MNSLQTKIPSWIGAVAYGIPAAPWSGGSAPLRRVQEASGKAFQPTAEESARFLRIVSECGRIRTHFDLYQWLTGEMQHFLPHEVLLSAWGHFDTWELKLDVTSGVPGVRTSELAHCRIEPMIRDAYARWTAGGRQPVLLKATELEPLQHGCPCAIHQALRRMRCVLVHGVHDKRSGHESLFIAFGSGSFTRGRSMLRFVSVLDPLVAQIDVAFRKVSAFPLADRAPSRVGSILELSAREMEVLEALCRGKTNLDIAATLDISPFTVKNHVQRIFRKIGVTNRTQAAARYAQAARQAAGVSGELPSTEALERSA